MKIEVARKTFTEMEVTPTLAGILTEVCDFEGRGGVLHSWESRQVKAAADTARVLGFDVCDPLLALAEILEDDDVVEVQVTVEETVDA